MFKYTLKQYYQDRWYSVNAWHGDTEYHFVQKLIKEYCDDIPDQSISWIVQFVITGM